MRRRTSCPSRGRIHRSCGQRPTRTSAAPTTVTGQRSSPWEVAPVASGEVATIEPADLPEGWVVTASGRISGVTEPGELSVHYPFPNKDLVRLDDALIDASRVSGARFAVYIGDLGSDTAARAREILAKVPTPNNAVLLA